MPELIPPYYASLASSGGTGDISIGARIPPHADLKGVVSYDDPQNPADKVIKYTIYHGKNIEWGSATVTTGGMLTGRTPTGKVENGTPDEASPTPLNITAGAFIHWRDPKQDAALAQLDQDVSTTASPTFAGLTLTKAGVLALAMLNSAAATGMDFKADADAARLTANASTPLGLGAGGTDDVLVVNADGTITATGGGSLTGTWTDLGSVTTIDINGGTIDGTVIGGSVAAAGSFTTLNATGKVTLGGGIGGQMLTIKPSTTNSAYIGFNAVTASPDALSGYIGYGPLGSSNMAFSNSLAGGQIFQTNGITWLTGDSTGAATFSGRALFGDGTSALPDITFANDLNTGFSRLASDEIAHIVGGLPKFYVGATGVTAVDRFAVGVGALDTDWGSLFTSVQVGDTGAIMAGTTGYGLWSGTNWYYDGTNHRYRTTGGATQHYMTDTSHIFRVAASGTAGAVLSWTTAAVMTSGLFSVNTPATFVGEVYSSTSGFRAADDLAFVWGGIGGNKPFITGSQALQEVRIGTNSANRITVTDASTTVSNKLTVDGGAKISVMNKADGGSANGVFLYDTDDASWGVYMASASGLTMAGTTPVGSLDGRTGSHFRFRTASGSAWGWIFEGADDDCKASLTADTGDLYTKGDINSGGDLNVAGMVNLGTPTELTISSGEITITKAFHTVDTEGNAATDDLDTINGGTEGDILRLVAQDGARTVVVKHATGNIRLNAATDFSLDSTSDVIALLYRGGVWVEETRSDNG